MAATDVDTTVTMTTYKRADGELIQDEYGWVADPEYFDYDDDPTELVEEVWVRQSKRTLVVPDPRYCTFDINGEPCESDDGIAWVQFEYADGGPTPQWQPRCALHKESK